MPFGMGRGRTGAAGEVGAVKRGFSFHRCGHAQVVDCAELPAWLLPDEQYRALSRIARWRLGVTERNDMPGQMCRLSSGYDA